jgi:methionyl-tRNA formyltransferase
MSILLLGPKRPDLVAFLGRHGEEVVSWELPLEPGAPVLERATYMISYGYRYILHEEIVSKFRGRAINLHISYLPWNRGADPNLWSFLEDTPKGVSIHYIEKGLDTGDILVQKEIPVFPEDTLRTTYERLSATIEELLYMHWDDFYNHRIQARPQQGRGTYHRSRDKEPYLHLLTNGWDTPVENLIGKAKSSRRSSL